MSDKGFTDDAIPALSICQSPLEGKFVQAWFDAMSKIGKRPEYSICPYDSARLTAWFTGDSDSRRFALILQKTIQLHDESTYRVDFEVRMSGAPGGLECAFVELDGAQWHSGIEKVAADKRRDRLILFETGIPVVRIPGSEVHKDAAMVVSQTIQYLSSQLELSRDYYTRVFANGYHACRFDVERGRGYRSFGEAEE